MESHIFLNDVAEFWKIPQELLGRVPEVHLRRVWMQATILPQQPEPAQQTGEASTTLNDMASHGTTY